MGKNNKKKTQKEFIDEVILLHNDEYSVVGEYINAKTKIKFKHNVCENIFEMTPTNFLSGQQCPHCKSLRRSSESLISNEEFKKEIYDLVGDEYTVMSQYTGRLNKITIKHNKCNKTFHMTPNAFINKGNRCTNRQCLHERMSDSMRDSDEQFRIKFNDIANGDYKLLSQYTLSNEKIKIRHKICGHIFSMKPNNFLQGQGCPYCSISKAELKIRNYCEEKNINYIWQKGFNGLVGLRGGELLYDFYFPKKNLLLEYQGQFHDGSLLNKCQTKEKLYSQQEHDKRKREYANSHNIKLLEIWYWDFENIEEILERELGVSISLAS